MDDSKKTLHILDISSFIFRAFYAVRELSNSKGEPTNAVFGVAQMLISLFEEQKPEYVLVAFDSKEPSFRKVQYDLYKANRSAPPEALIPQFARIESLLQGFRLRGLRMSGVEADDIIATWTKLWLEKDPTHQVVIVSGDKDLMQLVNGRVSVLDTLKQKNFKHEDVVEKFGIGPERVRDYLALIGDSSDNIPGVPSIGPKTAVQLIHEFGGVDAIYAALEEGKISGKKATALKEHHHLAKLSYDLVGLKDDLFSDFAFEEAKVNSKSFSLNAELSQLLEELELRAIARKLHAFQSVEELPQHPKAWVKPRFETVLSLEQLKKWVKLIQENRFVSFDLETTSLSPNDAHIVGVALAVHSDSACYIPLRHSGLDALNQLQWEEVYGLLREVWANPSILKLAQNSKYDLSVLRAHGVEVSGKCEDTMLLDYLLDPEGRHSLEVMAEKYGQYKVMTFESVCGKGQNAKPFSEVDLETATQYSAEDAWVTLKIYQTLKPRIDSDLERKKIYEEMDRPLVDVLSQMELAGISIDESRLQELKQNFKREAIEIEKKVRSFSQNPEINLQSPKQLAPFLFDELKLPPQGKTKTGYSTDASVLEALAPLHEVPRLLLEHRELMKLIGTYLEPMLEMRSPKTKRIHTSFHQASTSTGRLSSSDPNLQNIPIRTPRGERIRQLFVAAPGCVLISADYSQIELRILAELSRDPDLVDSFQKRQDIHRRTAAELYHVEQEKVTDEMRAVAKAINFGLMYGKTPFGLSQELGIPRSEAQDMITRYFTRYAGVKNYLDQCILKARENGYVETIFGRRRYLKDIRSQNHAVRTMAERLAMNSPIQGTAADLMRLAMLDVHETLKGTSSRMLLQVHDEVVVESPRQEAVGVAIQIKQALENAWSKRREHVVPLDVNVTSGENWLDQA